MNWTNFLKCSGLTVEPSVAHEKNVPYCPEHPGKIEIEMRTIVEATKTMMAAKNMEKQFWTEAVNTAVYIINRSGQVQFLCGDLAYIHVPKQNRKKLDPKAKKKGIFVGYGESMKGYRIYLPDEGKIHISCNVFFPSVEYCRNEQHSGANVSRTDSVDPGDKSVNQDNEYMGTSFTLNNSQDGQSENQDDEDVEDFQDMPCDNE
ncbi:hypothetical protein PR048_007073 [Dryococelus australis]|uniref:Retroviral polymerase SH3-like domain-containing protein n=1 Tax=Dryococelus australis TaxID=614101 RepID=A0ABQ9ICL9_9NEOP|nr:hypothetical protein PR048_007073 [Dryococelus australis]